MSVQGDRDVAFNIGHDVGLAGVPYINPYPKAHFCFQPYRDGYMEGRAKFESEKKKGENTQTASS